MNEQTRPSRPRILTVDDNPAIHEDYRKILAPVEQPSRLAALRATVLGAGASASNQTEYEIVAAMQGRDAVELVADALDEDRPFSLAFVDMRMPPGWDGIETIQRLWQVDPYLEIVICTAFSDYEWEEIQDRLGKTDQLLILKKPFESIELLQMASALTTKWTTARESREQGAELEALNQRLQKTNDRLQIEVSERRRSEDLLRHNAFHDSLTGLPNRSLLLERVERNIERSKRDPEHRFAVLFIDLDDFKLINDGLGHRAGDDLLVQVGRRIADCCRTLDTTARPRDDTTARFGGDEFVVLLDGLQKFEDAEDVAGRIQEECLRPFICDGKEVVVKLSMGIATSDFDYDDAHDLLRDADTALYDAKRSGRGVWQRFNSQMRDRITTRIELERELHKALPLGQLRLFFQPVICLSSGKVVSFESLLRWEHPERGFVPPAQVVPIAEEAGLIVPIGTWAVREACRQLGEWRRTLPNAQDLTISVNVSRIQLQDPEFLATLEAAVRDADIEPGALRLEITEGIVLDRYESLRPVLQECRTHGFKLCIDDFGTGYSSLSALDTIPFDVIKMDRSFLTKVIDRQRAATIQAVQTMASNRNMTVVIEGIECFEQLVRVQSLDCNYGQGYYFSKPVPAEQINHLLDTERRWHQPA